MRTDPIHRSIEVILENQHPSGAYIACPTFPSYQYCWFRDASFIAYAMDLVGEKESASRFHDWAARQVNNRADIVKDSIVEVASGKSRNSNRILHTRYNLDGTEGISQEWPNFQLDGFGTWLWSLREHHQISGSTLPESWLQAANLVSAYLEATWRQPCFDCWEEFPDFVHPHTLAAIFAGLAAHTELCGEDHSSTLGAIKKYIETHNIVDGHFAKFSNAPAVDSNLIGLAVPYHVFSLDDPRIQATITEIESSLCRGGGLHRYAADTYYGGGEWILLAAWLGWYHAQTGDPQGMLKACHALDWVESQFTLLSYLPEQTPNSLNDPSYYQFWINCWGEIATPLLWSHAMHIILSKTMEERS